MPGAKNKIPKVRSQLEELFYFQVKAASLPEPTREFRFQSDRRWRFDFAWPLRRFAVEVEGGIWNRDCWALK